MRLTILNSTQIEQIRKKLACWWHGHSWKFVFINLEGEKVFECRRCGERVVGKYVGGKNRQ